MRTGQRENNGFGDLGQVLQVGQGSTYPEEVPESGTGGLPGGKPAGCAGTRRLMKSLQIRKSAAVQALADEMLRFCGPISSAGDAVVSGAILAG